MAYNVNFLFICQNGMQFYWYFLENIQQSNNKVDSFEALYCTMALISIELLCKELIAELVRLALDIQVMFLTICPFVTNYNGNNS